LKLVSGLMALEICFAAPHQFDDKDGAGTPTERFDYDGNPSTGIGGEEGFVGLLADCPDFIPAIDPDPCVLDRVPAEGGGAIVTFFDPLGDPLYR